MADVLSAAPPRGRIAAGARQRVPRIPQSAAVFALYFALAVLYVGRYAVLHPMTGTVGTGPDVQIFIWGLRWWPFAIGHGLDPLISHVVWPPYGSDILWTTTTPFLSLLAAPVTLTLGPTAAWNLLSVLGPAAAAWGAYELCYELTGRLGPSLVGGLVFGFSSYELAESLAHLQMSSTVLLPLGVLCVVRQLRGHYGDVGFMARIALIGVIELLIAPELLATMVLTGAVAGLAALALFGDRRRALVRTGLLGACGLAAGAVVASPLLIRMLIDNPAAPAYTTGFYSVDLANLIIPTRITAVGSRWATPLVAHFHGNLSEQTGYLGVPLLVILAVFMIWSRRRPLSWLLGTVFAVSVLLSLGPHLRVAGHQLIGLPEALVTHVPILRDAMPSRLMVGAALAAAVMVALWLATGPGRPSWRWMGAALVVASLFPSLSRSPWWKPTPTGIRRDAVARIVPAGSTVISLPFWNPADRGLYAQAVAGMRFRVVDRWEQVIPVQYRSLTADRSLWAWHLPSADVGPLEARLCHFGIGYAMVWRGPFTSPGFLNALHLRPIYSGDPIVYRLPACTRD
jgi:hypothetical protein